MTFCISDDLFVKSNITGFPLNVSYYQKETHFKLQFKFAFIVNMCYCPDLYVEMMSVFKIYFYYSLFFKSGFFLFMLEWYILTQVHGLFSNRNRCVVHFYRLCIDIHLWNQWLDGNILCESFKCTCNCVSGTSFAFLSCPFLYFIRFWRLYSFVLKKKNGQRNNLEYSIINQ